MNNKSIFRGLTKIDRIQTKLQKIYTKTYQNILQNLRTSTTNNIDNLIVVQDIRDAGIYNVYLIYDNDIVIADNLLLQYTNDKLLFVYVDSEHNLTLIDIDAFINVCDELKLLVMFSYKADIKEEII